MKKLGLSTEIIRSSDELKLSEPVVGCIVIANTSNEIELLDDNNIDARLFEQPKYLLGAAKALLSNHTEPDERFYVYVTERGGVFSSNEYCPAHVDQMAGSGFVKTVHLEFPKIQTRVIDFNPAMSSYLKAALVVDEITHGDGHVDAGYLSEEIRAVPEYKLQETSNFPQQDNSLIDGDTLIVTGGGKGITAECILELALKSRG